MKSSGLLHTLHMDRQSDGLLGQSGCGGGGGKQGLHGAAFTLQKKSVPHHVISTTYDV